MHKNSRINLLRQYGAFVGVCFVIGAILTFVIASYLNRGSIQQIFSFIGNDSPAGYVDSVKPKPLGVHYFGDFLLPRWQSQMNSPWFIKDPAQGPLNNYLPFTMAVFWIFTHLSYWTSFVLYMLIPIGILLFVVWKSLSFESLSEKAHFVVTSIVLTLPFISLVDRGNIQIYVVASLALALWLFCNEHGTWGAVALGFSIALKGYPVFLIAVWIHAKRWKDVMVAAMTSIGLTVAPLLFYDGGITRNISRIFRNVRINEDLYAADSLAFNNSLRGCLLTLSRITFLNLGNVFNSMYEHFMVPFLVLALVTGLLVLFLNLELVEVVVLAAVLMSTFVDYVAAYSLGVYFLFLVALALTGSSMPKWPMRLLMFSIAIQMAPKGFPLRFWSLNPTNSYPTYTSLLGGLSSLMSFIIVVAVVLHRTKRNKSATANNEIAFSATR